MAAEDDKKKALTKDRLVGMKIISGEGNLLGEIKDVAFTVGTPISMVIIYKSNTGEDKETHWEEVQAAGDFVVLKPKPVARTPPPAAGSTGNATCPICGGPLTFIQQYQRWYCHKDQKYV